MDPAGIDLLYLDDTSSEEYGRIDIVRHVVCAFCLARNATHKPGADRHVVFRTTPFAIDVTGRKAMFVLYIRGCKDIHLPVGGRNARIRCNTL